MEVSRTTYEAALYRAGKRIGSIMEFDTLPEAQDYCLNARTPNGALAGEAVSEFDFRAQPDETWEGMVIRQVKTLHRPGDPITGVRVFC